MRRAGGNAELNTTRAASRAAASVDDSDCVIFTCVCEAGLLLPAGPTDGVRLSG